MNTKKNLKAFPIMNMLVFVATVLVNALSNVLPLNGRTAGEISDSLPSYFTPAGYTFSIWSLIYLSLLAYAVYQLLPAQRERPFQSKIGWLFVANGIANSGWIFAWHFGLYTLSVLIMIVILLTLIAIYVRLGNGRPGQNVSTTERYLVQFPFSLYMGWITVATIANIASVSAYLGWNGFGIPGPTWSAIMMGTAVIVAGLLLVNRRDFAYAGVLVWALFGIRAAYTDISLIATTAVTAAALVIVLALVGFFRTRGANGSLTPKMA